MDLSDERCNVVLPGERKSNSGFPLILHGKRIDTKFYFKDDNQTVDKAEIILLDNSLTVGLK